MYFFLYLLLVYHKVPMYYLAVYIILLFQLCISISSICNMLHITEHGQEYYGNCYIVILSLSEASNA